MKWEISYSEADKIIYVITEEILDSESEELMRKEIKEHIKKYSCLRILIDFRKIKEIKLHTSDIYYLPKKYDFQDIPHNIKLALVIHKKFLEEYKFFENVTRNRGFITMLFYGFDEAVVWLKE